MHAFTPLYIPYELREIVEKIVKESTSRVWEKDVLICPFMFGTPHFGPMSEIGSPAVVEYGTVTLYRRPHGPVLVDSVTVPDEWLQKFNYNLP